MREVSFLLVIAVLVGLFYGGMSYKEADILRGCNNYGTFVAADARYTCNFSHNVE